MSGGVDEDTFDKSFSQVPVVSVSVSLHYLWFIVDVVITIVAADAVYFRLTHQVVSAVVPCLSG